MKLFRCSKGINVNSKTDDFLDLDEYCNVSPVEKEPDILSEFKEWEKAQNQTEIHLPKAQSKPKIHPQKTNLHQMN